MQAVAYGQLGSDPGDGESRSLGSERRGARHPRVHLDDQHLAVLRIQGELNVAAARFDAYLADARDGGFPHALVLDVAESLGRGHGNGVSGVHPHGIEVLDGTDDDDVVGAVAHHLQLVLLPSDHRAVYEHLGDGRGGETAGNLFSELRQVVGDASARTSQREGRSNDGRVAHVLDYLEGFVQMASETAVRNLESDAPHRFREAFPIFGHLYGAGVGSDQLHAVLFQNAARVQLHGYVESRLPAHGREEGVGTLPFDHPLHPLRRYGFDVRPVREIRVRHDRRRVRVDEHHPVALLLEGADGLRPGIVELARLAYDDGAGADEKYRLQVLAPGH